MKVRIVKTPEMAEEHGVFAGQEFEIVRNIGFEADGKFWQTGWIIKSRIGVEVTIWRLEAEVVE